MGTWALAAVLTGCTVTAPPARPRPPLPLPPACAALSGPIAAPALLACEDLGAGRQRGRLHGGDETVAFELWRAAAGDAPRPLVLLVPILAGGAGLMEAVAQRLHERGFDVTWCARAGEALVPPQRGPDLDRLFERTILHQRLLLAWLATPGQPPATGTFVLGISLGGMVATAVAALEPGLDGVAICLAGGDLPTLLPHSRERRVQRWLAWRAAADGVGRDHLAWELGQYLRFEPLAMAAAIATDKALLVEARYDDVVQPRNQELLWEALGRPVRYTVPFGHYSAALAIGPILDAAAAHFLARIPSAAGPEVAAR